MYEEKRDNGVVLYVRSYVPHRYPGFSFTVDLLLIFYLLSFLEGLFILFGEFAL